MSPNYFAKLLYRDSLKFVGEQSMSTDERRVWVRHNIDRALDIKTTKQTHTRGLNDISAGGASIQGGVAEFEDEAIEIGTDDFGNFKASVVREWDDGFAVEFDIEDDDKYSLQEDLEAFRRENDMMPE